MASSGAEISPCNQGCDHRSIVRSGTAAAVVGWCVQKQGHNNSTSMQQDVQNVIYGVVVTRCEYICQSTAVDGLSRYATSETTAVP